MSRPNIRPDVAPHSECWRQAWPLSRHQHLLGDVRRCHHGKVQVLTEVGPNASVAGPGTHWWRDLSPFWDRKDYRAAIAALGEK
jgi:hypothetical protein